VNSAWQDTNLGFLSCNFLLILKDKAHGSMFGFICNSPFEPATSGKKKAKANKKVMLLISNILYFVK
jgi:hypothetical protein